MALEVFNIMSIVCTVLVIVTIGFNHAQLYHFLINVAQVKQTRCYIWPLMLHMINISIQYKYTFYNVEIEKKKLTTRVFK